MVKHLTQSDTLKAHVSRHGSSVQVLVASYFFDFKSIPLARSVEGMLRALLFQILKLRQASFPKVVSKFLELKKGVKDFTWQRRNIEELFSPSS